MPRNTATSGRRSCCLSASWRACDSTQQHPYAYRSAYGTMRAWSTLWPYPQDLTQTPRARFRSWPGWSNRSLPVSVPCIFMFGRCLSWRLRRWLRTRPKGSSKVRMLSFFIVSEVPRPCRCSGSDDTCRVLRWVGLLRSLRGSFCMWWRARFTC